MFGNNKRLEGKLREHGRQAKAEVLAAEQTSMAITHGSDAIVGNTEIVWKLKLRVKRPHEWHGAVRRSGHRLRRCADAPD